MSLQCLKCGYSVTEQICASCIVNEIKDWLYGQGTKKSIIKKIDSELKSMLYKMNSLDFAIIPSLNVWDASIMKCIKCKKDIHLMCFFCATNLGTQVVESNLRYKSSIKDFHNSFNLDYNDIELGINNLYLNVK